MTTDEEWGGPELTWERVWQMYQDMLARSHIDPARVAPIPGTLFGRPIVIVEDLGEDDPPLVFGPPIGQPVEFGFRIIDRPGTAPPR